MSFWRPTSSIYVLRSLSIVALLALSAAGATSAALAANAQPTTASIRLQRPIADDPGRDQALVAQLPTAPAPIVSGPAPTSAAAKDESQDSKEDEAEYQIASVGPAMRPLHPVFSPLWPSTGIITTYFGEVGPYSPRGHAGVDIANDTGTPILAADEGEVLKAYWDESGYGGLIVIGHHSGYETWYGHLSRIGVEKGALVDKGEQIGRMGSTGYSTGPHLHFEVRQEGELRDPLDWLAESALKSSSH